MKKHYTYQEKISYGPPTAETYDDLMKNTRTLDRYIDSEAGDEFNYAASLIKRGACFLVIQTSEGYRFYPSRFIGYKDNTMNKHKANNYKDGKITNPVITRITKTDLRSDDYLEREYIGFCESFGFLPDNKNHRFWKI